MTSCIHSVFNWKPEQGRCSYLHKGSFNYAHQNYAYVIRPTRDGAQGTLRIRRKLMLQFLAAYWPKTMRPKLPDILVAEQGFGWWKVESLSEVGDISVHTFFKYLNLWMLRRAEVKVVDNSRPKASHYEVVAEFAHRRVKATHVVALATLGLAAKVAQANVTAQVHKPVEQARLTQLVHTVNERYGHAKPSSLH